MWLANFRSSFGAKSADSSSPGVSSIRLRRQCPRSYAVELKMTKGRSRKQKIQSPVRHRFSHRSADRPIFTPANLILPSGESVLPAGKSILPSGKIVPPPGKSVLPARKTVLPSGKSILPAGKFIPPAGKTVLPSGKIVLPDAFRRGLSAFSICPSMFYIKNTDFHPHPARFTPLHHENRLFRCRSPFFGSATRISAGATRVNAELAINGWAVISASGSFKRPLEVTLAAFLRRRNYTRSFLNTLNHYIAELLLDGGKSNASKCHRKPSE
jgi:hypothetical protein